MLRASLRVVTSLVNDAPSPIVTNETAVHECARNVRGIHREQIQHDFMQQQRQCIHQCTISMEAASCLAFVGTEVVMAESSRRCQPRGNNRGKCARQAVGCSDSGDVVRSFPRARQVGELPAQWASKRQKAPESARPRIDVLVMNRISQWHSK